MEQKMNSMVPIVLIADDVEANRLLLKDIISEMGCQAVLAENGVQALKLAQHIRPQLIILDIAMPEMDGYEACRKLKENIDTKEIPVIFISALDEPNDIVRGFSIGGEDYIVKPFEIAELMARVNIVLRRYKKTEKTLEFRDIVIDIDNQMVTKNGEQIELTPKEFELITLLVRNVGITLVRDKIYEEIWGMEYSVETRTLDLHIQRLRKKLDLNTSLKTVFKVGYRLE